MDRIGEGKTGITQTIISLAACEGAPATIQPGAVVQMADALEELLNADLYADAEGLYYIAASDTEDGELAVSKARAALTAYYGDQT